MKRDFLILIIAIASGFAAFVMVSNYLSHVGVPEEKKAVFAAKNIAKGQVIKAEDITLSPVGKEIPPEEIFLQVQDALERVVLEDIAQGNLVARSKTKLPRSRVPLPAQDGSLPIPKEMRAMMLTPNNTEDIPLLLEVGNYVDILGTVVNYEGKQEIKAVLQSVQVIALKKSQETEQVRSVTIAVTPLEAEALARSMSGGGKIRIVVRSERGKKPAYQPSETRMEVIRGVEREPKVVPDVRKTGRPLEKK